MKNLTRQTLKIFWQHARKYKLHVFLLVSGIIAASAIQVYIPFWYKDLFNVLADGPQAASGLYRIIFIILALNLVAWLLWRTTSFAIGRFESRVMADLTDTCFRHLHKHSYRFFTNNFTGSLVRKVSRYEDAFEVISDNLYWVIGLAFVRLIFIIGVLFFLNPFLSLAVLGWVFIYCAFQFGFSTYKLKYDVQRSEADTQVSARLADTVANNINIKLFGSYKRETRDFSNLTEDLYQKRKFSWDLANVAEAGQALLMILLEFAILYMAVGYWRQGDLTLGDFALLQSYLMYMFDSLWDLGRYIRRIYEKLSEAEEMTAILLEDHEIEDKAEAGNLQVAKGSVEYRNVTFGYGTKNTLEDFSLKVHSGEKLALIGPSGGGKTTIVKLLFRFFDIQKGQILIDGQDIASVTQESLRDNLSLVPQEPILFHRSLMDNIRYARPEATDEEVIEAAQLAHCHEFISGFSSGYDTMVGERGIKLSGGERQRVAIARAILKGSPILVLDEATSSLDSESEQLIQDALSNLMRGKTTIVIAHRLSTIMQMDRIVVIQNGRVVEEGTHDELLKLSSGSYQKLWNIQAGGFVSEEKS